MGLAVVEVQVERALGVEQPAGLAQPRLQEAEVVVEAVAVGRALEQLAAVAAAAEPGAVAVARRDRPQPPARCVLAGVERRVEVDHPERAVGERRHHGQVIAEQDLALHAA